MRVEESTPERRNSHRTTFQGELMMRKARLGLLVACLAAVSLLAPSQAHAASGCGGPFASAADSCTFINNGARWVISGTVVASGNSATSVTVSIKQGTTVKYTNTNSGSHEAAFVSIGNSSVPNGAVLTCNVSFTFPGTGTGTWACLSV